MSLRSLEDPAARVVGVCWVSLSTGHLPHTIRGPVSWPPLGPSLPSLLICTERREHEHHHCSCDGGRVGGRALSEGLKTLLVRGAGPCDNCVHRTGALLTDTRQCLPELRVPEAHPWQSRARVWSHPSSLSTFVPKQHSLSVLDQFQSLLSPFLLGLLGSWKQSSEHPCTPRLPRGGPPSPLPLFVPPCPGPEEVRPPQTVPSTHAFLLSQP